MFDEHQLLDRIRQAQEDRVTGLLELEKDSESISFCFEEGLMAAGVSTIERLQLGRILYRRGLLQNTDVPKLLQVAQRKRITIGKAAVKRGLLGEIELREGVRDQIVQLVSHALTNDFTIQSFKYAPQRFYLPAKLNVDQLILDLARAEPHSFPMDGEKPICLKNRHVIPHLPFYPEELFVLNQLKKPRTLPDLATRTGIENSRSEQNFGRFRHPAAHLRDRRSCG